MTLFAYTPWKVLGERYLDGVLKNGVDVLKEERVSVKNENKEEAGKGRKVGLLDICRTFVGHL